MTAGYRAIGAEDRAALTALCTEYCWRVDNHREDIVHELFAEGAEWRAPGLAMRGLDAIHAGWSDRAATSRERTARHLIAGLRFTPADDGGIDGVVGFTLYGAAAGVAVAPVPLIVGEHHDRYVRQADGHWLFALRVVVPIFPSDWSLAPREAAGRA